MATASKNHPADEDLPDDLRQRERRFNAAHLHGIKSDPLWNLPNRHFFTYFLLPQLPPNFVLAEDRLDIKHFATFWNELDDMQKERRLLASYMAATFLMENLPKGYGLNTDAESEMLSARMESAVIVNTANFFLIQFRTDFVLCQEYRDHFEMAVKIAFLSFIRNQPECFKAGFGEIIHRVAVLVRQTCFTLGGFAFAALSDARTPSWAEEEGAFLGQETFKSFITMYSAWRCLDERGKKRYLAKLRVAVPHWHTYDRQYLITAIKTNGKSCGTSYVAFVLNKVGKEQFRKIVFGKEKFCSYCRRSSYTGDERLWTCRRCVEEHVRPKARYCTVECQKKHWFHHRWEAHGGEKPKSAAAAAAPAAKKASKKKPKNKKRK